MQARKKFQYLKYIFLSRTSNNLKALRCFLHVQITNRNTEFYLIIFLLFISY